MFRFLLVVLVLGAIGLALTNPTTDDVRAQLNAQTTGAVPSPAGQPVVPQAVTSALTDKMQGEIQLERTNYYLFSLYKVSVGGGTGGKQLPGCVIGIAKQAIPYDKC
jgi:hypothetical protein